MPKTLPQRIVFTLAMAFVMVYTLVCYNIALDKGGMSNSIFLLAFHEIPIMWPAAFILEFFVVEKLSQKLAFRIVTPGVDKPIFIILAISSMIVCLMCPVMSLIATLLFKEPSFGTWVQTWGCNMPMALIWQLLFAGPLTLLIFRTIFRKQLAESAAEKH